MVVPSSASGCKMIYRVNIKWQTELGDNRASNINNQTEKTRPIYIQPGVTEWVIANVTL